MEDCSEKPNPKRKSNLTNLNYSNKEEEEKKMKKNEFEFCKVCKLNHNQGPRHKYFPNHKNSLSAFLSRFQNKINDIRFFLKSPTILRPELADRNRFWCVFCDTDVDELDSSFACENAINHLAGSHHLKNLKHFLWKYGGKVDRLDMYRILETDLTKWEKKCKSLKIEAMAAPGEGSCGVVYGASNGMSIRYLIQDSLKLQNSVQICMRLSHLCLQLTAVANKIFFTRMEYAQGMLALLILGCAKCIRVKVRQMEKAVLRV